MLRTAAIAIVRKAGKCTMMGVDGLDADPT